MRIAIYGLGYVGLTGAICRVTSAMSRMLCEPSGALGVPTQTIAMSLVRAGSTGSVVQRILPLASASASMASSPGSRIGDAPEAI